jgi:hypothetical protein
MRLLATAAAVPPPAGANPAVIPASTLVAKAEEQISPGQGA